MCETTASLARTGGLIFVGLILMAGCTDTSSAGLPGDVFRIEVGEFQTDADVAESEDNNQFADADAVTVTPEQPLALQGQIDNPDDLDIYDLGPLSAGTRIVIEVTGERSLDTQITLFDEQEAFFDFNDDRDYENGDFDPRIDRVLRYDSLNTWLVVEMDFGAKLDGSTAVGQYAVSITLTPGLEVPTTRTQNLVVNFEGASSVSIEDYYHGSVPSFEPAFIDPAYAGQRDAMIGLIMDGVRKDYESFGVNVYRSTDEGIPWPNVTFVHVGGTNPELYGIANAVDDYNADLQEEAIVYAETFTLLISGTDIPSTEEMAQALANVVTHESGHLLGLHHTVVDPGDIMQTTSTGPELLLDESFGTARLDYHAVGLQDSIKRLFYTVGGNPALLTAPPPDRSLNRRAAARARTLGLPLIDKSMLGSCGCRHCVHGE